MKLRNLVLATLLSVFTVTAQTEDLTKPSPCRPDGAPLPSTANGDFIFAVLGDTGQGCEDEPRQCQLASTMETVQRATRFGTMFLLGDNVYTWGKTKEIPEKIFQPYRQLARQGVVVRGVVGNHDVISRRASELQTRFFIAPDAAAQERDYFSKDIKELIQPKGTTLTYYNRSEQNNLVEFFALDSSLIVGDYVKWFFWKSHPSKAERAAHLKWFTDKVRASTAKWKIVVMHHPMYSSADYHGVVEVDAAGNPVASEVPKEIQILRREIEPLLIELGVQLVLTGHDHGYERIKPQQGIQHFVSGAGAKTRENDYDRTKRKHKRFANFHECGSVETSFMLFSATRDKIDFWNVGLAGNVIDYGPIR
ncbi:MAG TPA: metallophosphoesterase [Pyrinomonadaceae bacterium]|nr:metallophosphoesterase [Pyrinomonadaceae bacterium]